MFKITYIEKGMPIDFKRIDTEKQIICHSTFIQGGLTYAKINEFNYSVIATEDILKIEKV